jgi:hypothetical protein
MEGNRMEQGRVILITLEKRVQLFSQLKDLLLQQQNALINGESKEIRYYAEMQLKCMENIHQLEMRWDTIIKNLRKRINQSEISVENILSFILNPKDVSTAFNYLAQLKELAKEIDIMKRNNALLLHNSISLIQNTLRFLQGNKLSDALYNPRRKTVHKNAILNKKL